MFLTYINEGVFFLSTRILSYGKFAAENSLTERSEGQSSYILRLFEGFLENLRSRFR